MAENLIKAKGVDKIMTEQITLEKQELCDSLTTTINNIKKLAGRVFPKGNENQTEIERLVRASIPDTYEWFEMKFNLIFEAETILELLNLIKEWQVYIINKANELIAFQNQLIAEAKGEHYDS